MATKKSKTAKPADVNAELLAALQNLLDASGHVSPFGGEISVKAVRLAGKYMAAVEAARAAIAKASA